MLQTIVETVVVVIEMSTKPFLKLTLLKCYSKAY